MYDDGVTPRGDVSVQVQNVNKQGYTANGFIPKTIPAQSTDANGNVVTAYYYDNDTIRLTNKDLQVSYFPLSYLKNGVLVTAEPKPQTSLPPAKPSSPTPVNSSTPTPANPMPVNPNVNTVPQAPVVIA